MQRLIKIAFFSLSLLLLSAHAIAPHNHQQPDTHDCNKLPGWIDFLTELVSGDLGSEHLEDYKPVAFASFDFEWVSADQPSFPKALLHAGKSEKNRVLVDTFGLFKHQGYQSTFSFRGPPIA